MSIKNMKNLNGLFRQNLSSQNNTIMFLAGVNYNAIIWNNLSNKQLLLYTIKMQLNNESTAWLILCKYCASLRIHKNDVLYYDIDMTMQVIVCKSNIDVTYTK